MPKNYYKGKGKFWDNEDHIIGKGFKRANESRWFKEQKSLLLWMANTDYGRDLLCIDKDFPRIINFTKNTITGIVDIKRKNKLDIVTYKTEVRIGAKWANIIRYRWQEFQLYVQEYYRLQRSFSRFPILFPVTPYAGNYCYTTTTVYPDPDPESTTMDGHNSYFGNPYSTAHDAADGNGIVVSGAAGTLIGNSCTGGCGTMQINRGHTLFDASSINAADTIDSATLTLTSNGDTAFADTACTESITLISTSPASNTNIVNGDYAQANFGSTDYTTAVGLTSLPAIDGNTQDFTINTAGLTFITTAIDSVAGIIKFGWRHQGDRDNCAPNANSSFGVHYADEAGLTQDPKLVIIHTGAAAANHWLLMGV